MQNYIISPHNILLYKINIFGEHPDWKDNALNTKLGSWLTFGDIRDMTDLSMATDVL